MEDSSWMIILLIAVIAVQTVAAILAIRLMGRTRYNVIWILCVVGFVLLLVERICQFVFPGRVDDEQAATIYTFLGAAITVCMSMAVLFAYRLIALINRLDRQRQQFDRRIMTAVHRTEERSRSSFAKELHDGLGPLLSSAKMSLSAITADATDEERDELLRNTAFVVDEAIRSVREISNKMSPQLLVDFGLVHGIRNFIAHSARPRGIDMHFTTNLRSERFDEDVELVMYRVVCELINNSLKHSGCSRIDISLSFNRAELRLDYSDNGCGFNTKAMMDCGMGLSNISSRISSLSGTFDMKSQRGAGMHATVRIDALGSKKTI